MSGKRGLSWAKSSLVGSILFCVTFLFHFIWCFYIFEASGVRGVARSQELLGDVYSVFGFQWSDFGSYLVAGALLSSLFLNAVRRILEVGLIGWPRFPAHNKGSLMDSFWMLLGYGLITFFAVGYFGEKFSKELIDFFDVMIVVAMTYIFGNIVNVIDEFLSALYVFCRGGDF